MTKVLHLVWNLIRGGTEGQCARVALELARLGHHHRVMVFRREGYFLSRVEEVCGTVEEIGIHGMLRWGTVQSTRHLARRLKEERFDLLHAWDADAAIFGQFAAAMAGIPLMTSRRDLGEIYPPYKVRLMRRADRKAVRIVANAEAIVDAFVRQGASRDKFRVIPNMLDAVESDQLAAIPFSRGAELPEGDRVVLVARLDPEKDVSTFLRAAKIIGQRYPATGFVMAGDGVERGRLEVLAAELGLVDRTVFLGDTTEVPALLRSCAIGMLTPSRNEGLSNTILEYMAASLPVVATDCGGNRELVKEGEGGFIVPVGHPEKLASPVLNLLDDPSLRKKMGAFNRRRIEEDFRPEAVGAQFEALYAEVAGSK